MYSRGRTFESFTGHMEIDKMSRSYKKPFGTVCELRSGQMKDWKKKSNKEFRRSDPEELISGSYYKKRNDVWLSPSDGKCFYGEDKKYTRK